MAFLLIFSGYWIVYWQEFISLPLYVHDYINPATNTDRMLSTGPLVVIALTVAMSVATKENGALQRRDSCTVISMVAFAILAIHSSVVAVYATLVVVAVGEIIQAPRYYEYIPGLHPPDSRAPTWASHSSHCIGSLIGGWFGGLVMHQFGEVAHEPQRIWWAISGVGVLTALLLWIYDRVVKPSAQEPSA